MDEVVTASPGEDSPLLNTEADTVYLPVTVSGGNAEVIAGSDTGEGAAVDSPEGNSPYTVVFSADAPDYSEALQQIHEDLLQTNQYLSEQADILAEQLAASQDQTVRVFTALRRAMASSSPTKRSTWRTFSGEGSASICTFSKFGGCRIGHDLKSSICGGCNISGLHGSFHLL